MIAEPKREGGFSPKIGLAVWQCFFRAPFSLQFCGLRGNKWQVTLIFQEYFFGHRSPLLPFASSLHQKKLSDRMCCCESWAYGAQLSIILFDGNFTQNKTETYVLIIALTRLPAEERVRACVREFVLRTSHNNKYWPYFVKWNFPFLVTSFVLFSALKRRYRKDKQGT